MTRLPVLYIKMKELDVNKIVQSESRLDLTDKYTFERDDPLSVLESPR